MKELINEIADKISHFETNSSEQLAVKTVYQIKMLINKSENDFNRVRESGL